jgi:hypothetical protein
MNGHTGVAAVVRLALYLEEELGAETLCIGRDGLAPEDTCVLESAGSWLAYRIALYCDEVRVAVSLMDAIDPPQTLLRAPDTAAGWQTVSSLVTALERHAVKSLVRPIEAGDGPDGFVIA